MIEKPVRKRRSGLPPRDLINFGAGVMVTALHALNRTPTMGSAVMAAV